MNVEALLKLPEAGASGTVTGNGIGTVTGTSTVTGTGTGTGTLSAHDNIYKKMYSINCTNRPKNEQYFSNYLGLILVVIIFFGIIYFKKRAKRVSNPSVKTFLKNHDIVKLIIGLLLLNHVRELSNSMVHNLIHPLIDPILPFIQCTFSIKYMDSHIEIGNFITDILIFIINIAILYILYLIMIS